MKKTLCILLVALMLLSVLVGCSIDGDTGNGSSESDSSAESESASSGGEESETELIEYDKNGYQKDKLGEELNFVGQRINICGWSNVEARLPEFGVKTVGSDVVKKAAYEKNMKVESRLNITLHFETMDGWTGKGTAGAGQAQLKYVENAMMAGASEDSLDIIGTYSWNPVGFLQKGWLTDMKAMPHIDLSAPWWNASIVKSTAIYDRVYFATGDIAPSFISTIFTVFYNKKVADAYQLGDLYALYDNDEWTVDKMIELSKLASSDVGTVGVKEVTDKFGYVSTSTNLDALYQGSGLMIVRPASDGTMLLAEDYTNSPKTVSLIEKLIAFNGTNAMWVNDEAKINSAWQQGNVLFNCTEMGKAGDWTKSDNLDELGILPPPKYDGSQENYTTTVGYYHTLYCIPRLARGDEAVGATLECLASESYRRVTPAYYDNVIHTRYAGTVKDAMMFDVVKDSVVIDSGRIFLQWDAVGTFRKNIDEKELTWSSHIASNAGNLQEMLDTFNSFLD